MEGGEVLGGEEVRLLLLRVRNEMNGRNPYWLFRSFVVVHARVDGWMEGFIR